ncbi:MAG: potassium channel family protein [Pyrinomonadaceae bacterium]
MTIICTLAGVGLLLIIAYDVYATVLHASARFGPVGETLNRTIWRVARSVAFRLPRLSRHKLLNAVGPLLLPLLIIIYVTLLVLAFALIYFPRMPFEFNLSAQAGAARWVESLYFSGVTVTTVGYGDIAPRTTAMRFVAMFESASGLALISLAVTYMLTAYTALERKRAIALSFYHQAEEGADAAGYVAHYFYDGHFYGLREALRQATRDLQGLHEAHIEHPVIHYFHPLEVYKSLPRVLFLLLEACAVIRTGLDEEEYPDVRNFPDVRALEASTRHVLFKMVTSLDLDGSKHLHEETEADETRRWKGRYHATLRRLSDTGIKTRRDVVSGWEAYRAQREEWESRLHQLAAYLGYDWDEVTGDRDLAYAADEEKAEPSRG